MPTRCEGYTGAPHPKSLQTSSVRERHGAPERAVSREAPLLPMPSFMSLLHVPSVGPWGPETAQTKATRHDHDHRAIGRASRPRTDGVRPMDAVRGLPELLGERRERAAGGRSTPRVEGEDRRQARRVGGGDRRADPGQADRLEEHQRAASRRSRHLPSALGHEQQGDAPDELRARGLRRECRRRSGRRASPHSQRAGTLQGSARETRPRDGRLARRDPLDRRSRGPERSERTVRAAHSFPAGHQTSPRSR